MAREDLLLAPESLEALIAGMGDLRLAFGPKAGPGLDAVRTRLEQALAARKGGDVVYILDEARAAGASEVAIAATRRE